MSLLALLALAGAGAAGAVCRVAVARWMASWQASWQASWPWTGATPRAHLPVGTLAVNVVGAFAAGMVAGWASVPSAGAPEPTWVFVLTVGFLGAFTTFSTWMVEAWRRLASSSDRTAGFLHVGITLLLGIAMAMAGFALGAALPGAH